MINFRSFSGLYFFAFGLNTERYGACHRIQSKCGKYGPENSEYRYFSRSEMPRHFRIFTFPEIARFQKFRLIKIPENPKAKVQCCSSRSSRFQGKDYLWRQRRIQYQRNRVQLWNKDNLFSKAAIIKNQEDSKHFIFFLF